MSGHRWWFMAVVVAACWWKGVAPQQQPQQAPAIWVMGDSLVDSGNNNFLSSSAKANYPPYGCDYYRGPTGRFCNARTFSDILGDWLGIAAPPPFADPSTAADKIMGGVNYASAAGGILDETGQHYVVRLLSKRTQQVRLLSERTLNIINSFYFLFFNNLFKMPFKINNLFNI
ncbi:putative cutinase [Helianthus anomalus]